MLQPGSPKVVFPAVIQKPGVLMEETMKQLLLGPVFASVLAFPVFAQPAVQSPTGNLERLLSLQTTGTEEPRPIPQEGRRADAIKRNFQKIKLPPGFKIELYAIVPDARHMTIGPNAGVVFVGTRKIQRLCRHRSR